MCHNQWTVYQIPFTWPTVSPVLKQPCGLRMGKKDRRAHHPSDTVNNWRQRWHQPQSSYDLIITETCKPPSSSLKWLLSGYSQPSGLPDGGRNLSLMPPCFSSPIKQKSEIKEDLRGVGKRMKWHHSLPNKSRESPHSDDFRSILEIRRQKGHIQKARGTTTGPELFLHDHLEDTQEPIYKVGTTVLCTCL